MKKGCQGENSKKIDPSQAMWNQAIADMGKELDAVEKRSGQLKMAIQTFKNNRDMGKPWPGTQEQLTSAP